MMRRPTYSRAVFAVTAVCAMLLTACSGPKTPLSIGVKRAALDLAFKEAELAKPPTVVRRIIEIPAIFEEIPFDEPPPRRIVIRRPPPLCAEADPNQILLREATIALLVPPKVGVYRYILSGKVTIQAAQGASAALPIPLGGTVNFPSNTVVRRTVFNLVKDAPSSDAAGRVARVAYQWEETVTIAGFTWRRILQMRSGGEGGIYMLSTRRFAGQSLIWQFQPTNVTAGASAAPATAIIMYRGGSPGAIFGGTENAGGRYVDLTRQYLGLSEGQVDSREFVDVCGKFEDSYSGARASYFQPMGNSSPNQYIYQTDPDDLELETYATHLSSIPVREKMHYKESFNITATVNGAPAQIPISFDWNYTIKAISMNPDPLPPLTTIVGN